MRRRIWGALAGGLVAVTAAALFAGAGTASLTPSSATYTVPAGGSITEAKTVGIPALPPSADIEIAIDTTGSMQPTIDQAKAEASQIVDDVQAQVPAAAFAIVSFKDNVDGPAEYQVLHSMTTTKADVVSAIDALPPAGGGDDAPEAQNLVFHNSYTPAVGGDLGWRTGTRKFVVMISDAEPHGASTSGFADCADTSDDPHGFDTGDELAGMQAAQRTLFLIRQVAFTTTTSLECYADLAAAAYMGGAAVDAGTSLADQIVSLIDSAFSTVGDVHLTVASASPAPASASWIDFTPDSVGPVPAPSTQPLSLTASVPAGTPAGTYSFDVEALADGQDTGHQSLTLVVPPTNQAKKLTLSPYTATRPIGTTQAFTAHTSDLAGHNVVGDVVHFVVTSGPDAGQTADVTTNSSGNAAFTVTNTPPTVGKDTVKATDGALSATSTVTWTNSPPNCKNVAVDVSTLSNPDHTMRTITLSGATDPDVGDSATITITGVTQDEPTTGTGTGDVGPDAILLPASNQVQLRAERKDKRDGRVYHVFFTVKDRHGATCGCSGQANSRTVVVPLAAGKTVHDSGPPSYNSLH